MSQKVARTSLPACKKELLFGAASPADGVGLVTTCSSAQSADSRPLCRACALNTRLLASSALICSTSNSRDALYSVSCYFSPHLNVIFRQMVGRVLHILLLRKSQRRVCSRLLRTTGWLGGVNPHNPAQFARAVTPGKYIHLKPSPETFLT